MRLLQVIIFLFSYTLCHSQQQEACPQLAKEFIQDILGKHFDNKKIYLTDSLGSFALSNIKETLDKGRFYRRISYDAKTSTSDSLVLTPEEMALIEQQLKYQNLAWLQKCFTNVQLVPRDTVDFIFQKITDPWHYFQKNYGYKLYGISNPIFLRDNSICLFYWDYSCGQLCGHGILAFYKKDKGKWNYYWQLLNWDS